MCENEERLQEAIEYYNQNKEEKDYSGRFVAEFFDVNSRTLARRISNKVKSRKGRHLTLKKDIDDLLAGSILHLAGLGFLIG
jgi:hypothetical protein